MEMDRRKFLQTAVAPAVVARRHRYNLLFLMSDQHQRDASGCYGNREVKTPHLDALAKHSVRFTSTYCPSPVCVPSRGSLVTGLYAHKHRARILQDALPASWGTIGHYFRERGYSTAAIGKMHFVDETQKHGFDHRLHEGSFFSQRPEDAVRQYRQLMGDAGGIGGVGLDLSQEHFPDNWFAERAIVFLRAHRDRPFCLWASFLLPHTPFRPMKRYFDLYDPALLTLPNRPETDLEGGFEGHLIRAKERGWYQQPDDQARVSLTGYYGNISQMDDYVGKVYDSLVQLGLDRSTVVVYTSDHGEMASAHRMYTKHNMFEQSVAVPLMISIPDGPRGGREEIIEQVDLFPTLVELCGLESVKSLHGRSFAGLMRGNAYTPREFAYSEYWFCRKVFTADDRYVGKPPLLMVRTRDYKLNYLSWGRSELFDLARDPGEFENRIDDPALQDVRRELTRIAKRQFALD
jgi:choline-sulfatase